MIKHSTATFVALLLLGLSLAGCGAPRIDDSIVDPKDALRDKLRQTVSVDWKKVPIVTAMRELADRYGVRIDIDRAAFKTGIDLESPDFGLGTHVSLRAEGIQLRSALSLALEQLDLAYILRDDGVEITSRDKANDTLYAKLYAVASVTGSSSPALSEYQSNSRPHVGGVASFGLGGGLGVSFLPSRSYSPPYQGGARGGSFSEAYLAEAIRSVIAPNSWDELGGPGECEVHPGGLLINQRHDVHEQIAELLEDLRWLADPEPRSARPKPTPAEAAVHKALDTRVSLDLSRPLQQLPRELALQLGINVVLDERSLRAFLTALESQPPKDVPAQYLTNVPLRTALDLMLAPLGCGWTVRHEVLLITSRDTADAAMVVRAYRLRFAGYKAFGESDKLISETTGEDFLHALQTCIAPDSWDAQGGPGSAAVVPHGILVAQRVDVHRKIEDLLEHLNLALDPSVLDYDERAACPDEQRLLQVLEQPTTVDFSDGRANFEQVLKELQTRHRIANLVFDYESIYGQGVFRESQLPFPENCRPELRLSNVSLGAVLSSLLDPFRLDWYVRDNVLIIAGREATASRMSTHVYRAPASYDDAVSLVDLVESHVKPESWEAQGGPGTLAWISNLLVVSQTREVHGELRRFVRQFESFADNATDPPHLPAYTLAERRLYEALERRVTYRGKDEAPMVTIAELASRAGVENLIFAWHEMGDEPRLRTAQQRTIIEVTDEPFADALTRLLQPLHLAWTVKHETLFITYIPLVTSQVSSCDDVVTGFYEIPSEAVAALQTAFGVRDADLPEFVQDHFYSLLIALVAPTTWEESGGPGIVTGVPLPDDARQAIVVTQTPAVHRDVLRFLDGLRRAPPLAVEMLREDIDGRVETPMKSRKAPDSQVPIPLGVIPRVDEGR